MLLALCNKNETVDFGEISRSSRRDLTGMKHENRRVQLDALAEFTGFMVYQVLIGHLDPYFHGSL